MDVEDDLGISNVSEVIELEMENNPSLIETIDSSERYFDVANYENPTAEVYATVTPPTGLDKFMPVIYIISGVIALAVISGGIILIKKKVLHK